MNIKYVMLLVAGMVLTFSSCEQKKKNANIVVNELPGTDSVQNANAPKLEGNKELNETARFVAGMPIEDKKSKLYALTQTPEWKKHSKNMDQIWNSFLQSAPKVMAYSQNELGVVNDQCKTLFYPFGGPDYLFPNSFFPNMDTYFLIGLERAGNAIKVKHPSVATYRLYQNAVSDILNLSFFRTVDMKTELSNDTIDGVVPIITMLMARSEREIVSIEHKRINNNGEIVGTEEDGTQVNNQSKLVEFKFFKKGTSHLQTLYFLSTDLSNGGLSGKNPLMAYIDKLNKETTACFIKSASYLMHMSYFSMIRNAILEHVSAIMQDDSGIPWRYYDKSKWDIQLYGAFTEPISMFAKYPQTDLRDAYQTMEPKPINFRIGYARQSNLQLSILKKQNED
jgi:hypothetical protein